MSEINENDIVSPSSLSNWSSVTIAIVIAVAFVSYMYIDAINRRTQLEKFIADQKISSEQLVTTLIPQQEGTPKDPTPQPDVPIKRVRPSTKKVPIDSTGDSALAKECLDSAQQKAVRKFYIECLANPKVGGSQEKCNVSDSQLTIGYIESNKAISFEVFEIAKQLDTDRKICTSVYGD